MTAYDQKRLADTSDSAKEAPAANPMADFYALKLKAIWSFFKKEHFSFWAICGYLVIEYVRPQSLIKSLDILPWGKVFIALSVLAWAMDPKKRWVSDSASRWMVTFLCVIVLSSFNAYWPSVSWMHFMDFFGWFLIYFLIINIVNSERRLFIFLFIFLLASFKLSQHGARTWAMRGFSFTEWGLMGPQGYFQNSGELAVQMLMFMPIAYRMAVSLRPWLTRAKYWLLLAFPLTAMMTIGGASSRGGQVGLAFQLYHTFLKGRLSFKTLVLAVMLGGIGYAVIPQEQIDRFRGTGGEEDRPGQQRLLYWKNGWEMIKDHPMLGVGYFNFAPYFTKYYPGDVLYKSAQLPHNIFIQVGTDAGFIGVAAYLMIILSSFRATRAARRALSDAKDHWLYNVSSGVDAALIGFLIAGQFVTIGYYPFMWINLAFAVAVKNVAIKVAADRPKLEGRG